MDKSFNFFKEQNNLDYAFIKAPKVIFYEKKYTSLSADARILYIAMLERQSLSLHNNWKDDNGNIYIILTHENAKQILSCSDLKSTKTFAELERAGLIKRKRRGLGKPDIIYLNSHILTETSSDINNVDKGDTSVEYEKNEIQKIQNKKHLNFKNKNSDVLKSESSDSLKMKPNNIKNNKNKINNINSSFLSPEMLTEERSEQKEAIKFNIDYDTLIKTYSKDIIDEIVASMTNAVCSKKDFISISGENIPTKEIKEKFLSMDQFHIEYVCDSLKRNTSDVKNINSYLLTCLYRAADNINIHYQLMANHDLQNEKKSKTHSGFYS